MARTWMHVLLGLYFGLSISGAWLFVVTHDPAMLTALPAEQLMLAGWMGFCAGINTLLVGAILLELARLLLRLLP